LESLQFAFVHTIHSLTSVSWSKHVHSLQQHHHIFTVNIYSNLPNSKPQP